MVKEKYKSGFFEKNYLESWTFLKNSKNFIYCIAAIFFIFLVVGAVVPSSDIIDQKIFEFIKELISKTEGMSHEELVGFIFLNNIQASFFGLVFGLVFGLFPLFSTIMNGYLVGYVASKSVAVEGVISLWKLFPHGVFELPALFISLGLGLKLGTFIFEEDKVDALKRYILSSLKVFFLVVVPLLIIAAVIEGSLIFFGN